MNRSELLTALTYPFEDPAWPRKLGLAYLALLLAWLVLPLVVLMGYLDRLVHEALNTGRARLPAWEVDEDLLVRGVRWLAGALVLLGPLVFLGILALFLGLVTWVASQAPELGLPGDRFALLPAVVSLWGYLGITVVAVPYGLVLVLLAPPAWMHMVAEQRFSALWEYRAWWPVFRRSWERFLMAVLVVLGLQMAFWVMMQPWTWLLWWAMPLLTTALRLYLGLVALFLFAQAYRRGREAAPDQAEEAG